MAASWDAPIKDELRRVEEEMGRAVQTQQPLLTEIATHVVRSGGKRIRPGISLLSFRSVGGEDPGKIIQLAAAFELIHSASLVHDDINDGAKTRRGHVAAYRKYGSQRAIITGDFLFVQGFRLGGVLEIADVIEIVADACQSMAESEILQIEVERHSDTPFETYLKIIEGKTARPIQASARVGAYIGGGSADQLIALGDYGLNIGFAFQIIDDILDITGREADTGKLPGVDIMEGKPNLPIMLAMRDEENGARIREVFENKEKARGEVEEVLAMIMASGAVEAAKKHAYGFRDKALAAIRDFEASAYKDALVALANTVVERKA